MGKEIQKIKQKMEAMAEPFSNSPQVLFKICIAIQEYIVHAVFQRHLRIYRVKFKMQRIGPRGMDIYIYIQLYTDIFCIGSEG